MHSKEPSARENRTTTSGPDVYRTTHDTETDHSLSVTVVEALAAAKGVSVLDFEVPLNDVIDPDALDRLFQDGKQHAHVVFSVAHHQVTVTADGHVTVERIV